ncbi:hypothetical protein [Tardiphaga sp. 839_C3_N1_4]|uniref:hypothetical protein n=1 Tax=Tardiphaga sp. 839_C3_N1_4 TaxID=3240761 RepID=UPI003F2952C1
MLALNFLTVVDAFSHDITDIVADPEPLAVNVRGDVKLGQTQYMLDHKDGYRELAIVRTVGWLHGKTPEQGAYRRDYVDAVKSAAHLAGYGFRLATEEQVYVEPRFWNARMMRRHLAPYRTDHDEWVGIEALQELPKKSSVPALQELLGARIDAFVVALRLDWLGRVVLDRKSRFSRTSNFVKT